MIFSAGREAHLQVCWSVCRLCPHLQGYLRCTSVPGLPTDFKHLTATAQTAVTPLDDVPEAVLFRSSTATAGQKGVAMVSVRPYKRKKGAKHVMFMLQVYLNQDIT